MTAAIGQKDLEYHKLFRVIRTACEMMEDRKYHVPRSEVLPETFEEFKNRYVVDAEIVDSNVDSATEITRYSGKKIDREAMRIPCEKRGVDEANRYALVYFIENPTARSLSSHVKYAEENRLGLIIFIHPGTLNAITKKYVDNINRTESIPVRIQMFEEDNLAVNITRHELVPKHIPLEENEVREMLEAHALQLHQLPRILTTDPVAAYFGLQRGQVVKIERKSMSAGVYVTYRQVV